MNAGLVVDLAVGHDGRSLCGIGSTVVSSEFWGSAVDTAFRAVEQSAYDSPLGQLFARRGISGVLFGHGLCGSAVEVGSLARGLPGFGCVGSFTGGLCGVCRGEDGSTACRDSRVRLPVPVVGLHDAGGTEGFVGASGGTCGSGEVRDGIDGECGQCSGDRSGSGEGIGKGNSIAESEGCLGGDAVSPVRSCGVQTSFVSERNVPGAFGKLRESENEVVSEKTLRNRERRRVKKELKNARKAGMKRDDWRSRPLQQQSVGQEKTELQKSLEAKWAAQNLLEKTRAERQLDILRSKDIEQEKRMQHSKMVRDTEKNLVAVEKAHGMLKATGNVPGFVVGTAETVVSGVPTLTSGSISPNSSVSEAEVRRMMKELEDLKVEHAKVVRRLRDRDLAVLESGGTVGFPADMSEGLENEIDQVIGLGREEFNYPEDPETVYIKRMPDSGDHWP